MNHFRLTPIAALDLQEIYEYVAARNLTAAGRLLIKLEEQFVRLAETPGIGRVREELAPELRSAAAGSYVVFYRAAENGVEIIRVLHGARDIPAIFEQMPE